MKRSAVFQVLRNREVTGTFLNKIVNAPDHAALPSIDILLRLMKRTKLKNGIENTRENELLMEASEEYISHQDLDLSDVTDFDDPRIKLKDLVEHDEWQLIVDRWRRFIFNPRVCKYSMIALCGNSRYLILQGEESFSESVASNVDEVNGPFFMKTISGFIRTGLLDLVQITMRTHEDDCRVTEACIYFLNNFYGGFGEVEHQCRFHMKILDGIIHELTDPLHDRNWFRNVMLSEGNAVPDDNTSLNDNDDFESKLTEIREAISKRIVTPVDEEIYPLVRPQMAQEMIDECVISLDIFRTVDLGPVIQAIMTWLTKTTAERNPDKTSIQLKALSFFDTALKQNYEVRTDLIKYGIINFLIKEISINNDMAKSIAKGYITQEESCDALRMQFAYYSIMYQFMSVEDNDDFIEQFSEADGVACVLETLTQASKAENIFEFELPGTPRKNLYYIYRTFCYPLRNDGIIPVFNVSELAMVTFSKMCLKNEYTNDTTVCDTNMQQFKSVCGFIILKMGLLSFSNLDYLGRGKTDNLGMSDEKHNQRELDLSRLLSLADAFIPNKKQDAWVKKLIQKYDKDQNDKILDYEMSNM